MGLKSKTIKFIEKALKKVDKPFRKISMCELGNQKLKKLNGYKWGTAKRYFESLGIKHVSIDMNGKDKSLKYDLGKIIKLDTRFDILTNMGTSEHVYNQYTCFANIHNLVKKGGIIVHCLPCVYNWKGHCQYRYTTSFFEKLSKSFGYSTIINKKGRIDKKPKEKVIWVIFRKTKECEFCEKEFNNSTKSIPSWGFDFGRRKSGYSYKIKGNELIVY